MDVHVLILNVHAIYDYRSAVWHTFGIGLSVIALPMLDSDEVFLAISCFRVEILKMVFKDFLKKSQNSHLFVKSTLNTNFSFQVFCLKIR